MKQNNEIIASNVKLLREIDRTTQEEFGRKYGSDQKSIWVYENGAHRPKPEFLLRLSRGVGISPEILLSVKLKKNAHGEIINLPQRERELQEIRKEIKKAFAKFRVCLEQFEQELQFINERVDEIEKQIKPSNRKLTKIA